MEHKPTDETNLPWGIISGNWCVALFMIKMFFARMYTSVYMTLYSSETIRMSVSRRKSSKPLQLRMQIVKSFQLSLHTHTCLLLWVK